MRRVLHRFFGAVVVLAVALPSVAATPSEFYLTMLRRGVAAYEAGRLEAAAGPLKIAAFGLVDSVEHYQTAQIHLALTLDRLGNAELAREAARRVVVAERIEARYRSLPLSAATRTNFDSLAQRLLTPADLAVLNRSTAAPTTPANTTPVPVASQPQPAPVKTEPDKSEPVRVDPPVVKTEPVKPEPVRPEPVKPEPVKPEPVKTEPVKTEPIKTEPIKTDVKVDPPVVRNDPAPAPKQNPPAPKPPPPVVRNPPPGDVPARFAAAEQALTAARLADARAIYRELLEATSLQRADLLRLAEGFYRSRDFSNALRAFERIGPLRRGEEPYRYYIAVALYETAQYAKAKQELAAVLPFIEQTPDVLRYRMKIEGAVN